ncbi:Calcium/proton exchanger, partial [Cryphonectria parasitica EP155]
MDDKPPTQEETDDKPPKKSHRLFKNVQPKEPFTVANQLQRTLLNSWINVLLVAAPVGIALGVIPNMNQYAIFVVNFVAIIPLAAMLSFATEEIALRTGETLGGLLNASFGNAVELIVAIIALIKKEIVIVQTSLIGSILSNLLLVMGMCFFFGGLRRQEQFFNTTVAQTAASLLALAIAGIIIPTVFDQQTTLNDSYIAQLSRGTAIILLVVYAAYLYFQLKTHHEVFSQESQKVPMRPRKNSLGAHAVKHGMVGPVAMMSLPGRNDEGGSNSEKLRKVVNEDPSEDEEEGDDPQLSFPVAMGTLAGSTVLIAFCAEFLVDSINYVTTSGGISQEFLGLILLPIVGNAAEHATAVTVAIKDKMDLAIGVAVGSSMQVALFIIPLLVVIGWGMGMDDMNLSFDIFQVAILFVSVLLVNYLIGDGKSHWLEGMLLMCLYLIIATCSW